MLSIVRILEKIDYVQIAPHCIKMPPNELGANDTADPKVILGELSINRVACVKLNLTYWAVCPEAMPWPTMNGIPVSW